jgi:hypothetical protein
LQACPGSARSRAHVAGSAMAAPRAPLPPAAAHPASPSSLKRMATRTPGFCTVDGRGFNVSHPGRQRAARGTGMCQITAAAAACTGSTSEHQ